MFKFFALLLLSIGLVLLGLALALTREHPAIAAVGLLGVTLSYFAFCLDGRHEKAAAEERDREVKRQVESLMKEPWERGRSLMVRTSSKDALAAFVTLVVGVLFSYLSISETRIRWGMLAGSSVLAALALFAFVRVLPSIEKPALVLNIEGLQTPLHGLIPWSAVGGVNLQSIAIRGGTTNILNFYIEDFARAAWSIHWTERVLALAGQGVLRRKVIAVSLHGSDEESETIAAIARFLWQKSTGMGHGWNPLLSDEANQAARRIHGFIDRYKDPNTSAGEILKDPDKALKELGLFRQDTDIVNSEQRRNLRKARWLLWASLLGGVATLLWILIRSHTHS